jgi:hypothetical protein
MKKPRNKRAITEEQIGRDLQTAMRYQGWLVPTTEDQVRAVERDIGLEKVELPESLLNTTALHRKLSHAQPKRPSAGYWNHASVLSLGDVSDPVRAITERARTVVLHAIEAGWTGPPYDPFALAELLRIRLIPTQDVIDARTSANAAGAFAIEFNPGRPPARIRYSIAHEIAHTLFPDCAKAVRHRGTHEQMASNEWQLEALCNIAASEILMPVGSLPDAQSVQVTVEAVRELRKKYQVSAEAVLLRLTRLTDRACLVFAARRERDRARYLVDYAFASRAWHHSIKPGFQLPKESKASQCTAIGYTARGEEQWIASAGKWNVEYVGIPPYPDQPFPRVLGIASPTEEEPKKLVHIAYLRRDATEPPSGGIRVLVHIVNDRAITWGGGFAKALRKKWPEAQTSFTQWTADSKPEFRLGAVHFANIDPSLYLASMVAQHGYGQSSKPRIRYGALASCLATVARFAADHTAGLHMPRIGSGQAGGSWEIISEIIEDVVCGHGVEVTVYDLPSAEPVMSEQPSLFAGLDPTKL